jgi:hypothetical protein
MAAGGGQMPFDEFYFAHKDIPLRIGGSGEFCMVKFGDSRKDSVKGAHRANVRMYSLHGNAQGGSFGKKLEEALLRPLVGKNMAMRIADTEKYVVRRVTRDALVDAIRCTIESEGGWVRVEALDKLKKATFDDEAFVFGRNERTQDNSNEYKDTPF